SSSIDYFEKYQLILFLCFKTENICSNKIIFFKKYLMMSDIEVDSSGSEWIPGRTHISLL
ncbi:hypothetical protein Avbf_11174, partial [Armadillidium vulgare]